MTHREVLDWFKLYFPQFAEHVEAWFPNGKNSIRIRQTNHQDFIFTYNSKKDWRFETVDSYVQQLRKEIKKKKGE